MRIFVIISTLLFLSLWLLSSCYYIGLIDFPFFKLTLPKTTAELGDSMGLLNGFFSSITVLLALIAIVYQSKELRDSTKAQNDQANALNKQLIHQQEISEIQLNQASALTQQLEQQQISNKIIALSARQKFIISETSRLSESIENLDGNFNEKDLYNNCVAKKSRLIKEANQIDDDMKLLLNESNKLTS